MIIKQWIGKVGNKYVCYDFGKAVKLKKDINKATIMNMINKNIIEDNKEIYAMYEPEYENLEWIEVEVIIN